ncbi:MAG: hypothetical protein QXI16_01100 [Sulfolobaceae archaeon]
MSKKYFILILLLGLFINLNLIKSNAGTMDENIDDFYYYTGDTEHYLYSSFYYPIDNSKTYFGVYIPYTAYSNTVLENDPNLKTIIKLYNSSYVEVEQLDLYELWLSADGHYSFMEDTGYGILWLEQGDLGWGDEFFSRSYWQLQIVQTYSRHADPVYLEWFNDQFNWTFNDDFDDLLLTLQPNIINETVTYYVGGRVWYKTYYDEIPPKPVDPYIQNFEFIGWWVFNGIDYDYYDFTPFEFGSYESYDTRLNAQFKFNPVRLGEGEYDNTPSALEKLLTVTGLNNTIGKLLLYVITLLLTIGLMLWIKLDVFIITLVEIILFGLFIFMGWIPIYMIIILGLIFATALIKSLKKGG